MNHCTFNITRVTAILLGALTFTFTASAGVSYQMESTEYSPGSQPQVSRSSILVEGENLKIVNGQESGNQPGEMIFLGGKNELLMIDHKRRNYMAINEEQMLALASKMEQAMAEYQKMLANVPPAQRKMMEKMMGNRMPQGMGSSTPESAIEIKETGEKENINGYPTRKYEIHRNGSLQQEQWVTDWSNMEGSEEFAQAFEGLASLFNQFMKSMTQGPMGAIMAQRLNPNSWLTQMEKTGGFPVMTRIYGADGKLTRETKIIGAEKKDIDASEFSVPKKYKRQKMEMGR